MAWARSVAYAAGTLWKPLVSFGLPSPWTVHISAGLGSIWLCMLCVRSLQIRFEYFCSRCSATWLPTSFAIFRMSWKYLVCIGGCEIRITYIFATVRVLGPNSICFGNSKIWTFTSCVGSCETWSCPLSKKFLSCRPLSCWSWTFLIWPPSCHHKALCAQSLQRQCLTSYG